MSIIDYIDISKDELEKMKKQMKDNEIITLYSDKKLQIKLTKIKGKVYEVINTFGDKDFVEIFDEMLNVRYGY